MEKRRPHVPIGVPIATVLLFILGRAWKPVMSAILGAEAVETQLLLIAAPFILTFAGIIMAYITVIWLTGSVLNDNISQEVHRPIERILILGIALGVIGLFQPWAQILYRLGFHLLLLSTFGFIWWSHIVPKAETYGE